MSYLENALNHKPVGCFSSQRANEAADIIASRAKFLVSIVEKVFNVVQTFFNMVLINTIPAILDLESGRQNLRKDAETIVENFKDIPVVLAGLVLGCAKANELKNKIRGTSAESVTAQ